MKRSFKDGAMVVDGVLADITYYDVSNNRITAQFDGRGAISKYAVMNKFSVFSNYYSIYSVDGVPLDWSEPKTVYMCGKKQVTEIKHAKCDIKITQFLDAGTNAIFVQTEVEAKQAIEFSDTVNFGINYSSYVEQLLANRLSAKTIATLLAGFVRSKRNGLTSVGGHSRLHGDVLGDFYIDFAISDNAVALEHERGFHNQFAHGAKLAEGEVKKFRYVVSAGTRNDYTFSSVDEAFDRFDEALAEADKYIEELACPDGGKVAEVKGKEFADAYYRSLLNCSLSNYKELGKFKGFLAGIVYQFPARTYYRDAYWTILSVLPVRPALVRNEIMTLAGGISKKGECPSAVKFNFRNYWGNHYDSPSFFVIMLYDYVLHTGDTSVLKEECACGTVYDAARLVLDRLAEETDETGLLVKGGEYNRRDWCDNVFRGGYVTYDEALYARALFAMAELSDALGVSGDAWYAKYVKVKKAINDLLWDESKGWYVNYKDSGFVEDNLSIDTVPMVLFGLCEGDRAKSVLANMERYLESDKNKEQIAGDWGTLSVYPFYKRAADIVQKSSLPYYYHNGGDWPYLSGVYAYAKLMHGMDYVYPMTRWFEYNFDKGNYTPVEFYSPLHSQGSLLQAWSSTGAFVMSYPDGKFFDKQLTQRQK